MRWALAVLALLLAAGIGVSPAGAPAVFAERLPLQVSVEAGFDGYMKQGRWFPVKVTVTNPGGSVSGELAIHWTENGSEVVYAQEVDLPANSTKAVWFTLPGASFSPQNNRIAFHERGVGKGAEVPFSQNRVHVEAAMLRPDALVVGVAARDPDTMNFLALMKTRGFEVHVTQLSIDGFPWKAAMLESVDVLAFNDAATDALTAAEVREIEAWVRRGGKLILAGGAGYAKTLEAFRELSPVRVAGTATVDRLTAFEKATGQDIALSLPLTVTRAEVTDGDVLFREGDVPLIVSRPYGLGEVIYAAYDLAAQPLASWSGNPLLWEQILEGLVQPLPGNAGRVYTNVNWELEHALGMFPQFIPPNFLLLALLFLAYAIVVGPLLYLILKKLDRREWAWAAIPVLAVLASVFIYTIGSTGRSSTLAQTLAFTELDGEGGGTRTAAASVFVPNGGEYTVAWEGEHYFSPHRWGTGGSGPMTRVEAVVRSGPERSAVTYRNVPFWTVRKMYAAAQPVSDAGRFAYELNFENGTLSGAVTNETGRELTDAGVLYGNQWISFGSFRPGERKTFSIPPNQPAAFSANRAYMVVDSASLVFPYGGRNDDKRRERALLNAYLEEVRNGSALARPAEPIIIGFAKDEEADFAIGGAGVSAARIELLAQRMRFSLEQDGRFVIPGGITVPFMELSSVTYMNQYGNGRFDVGPGDIVFAFRLPQRDGWEYEKVQLTGFPAQNFTYELWKAEEEAWVPISGPSMELAGDELAGALSEDGAIRLRLTSQTGGTFDVPVLAAEGRVKR